MKKILFFLLLTLPINAFAFSDLPEDHEFYPSISYLEYEGVVQGYDDGTVKPDETINRAELLKIIIEGLEIETGKPSDCFPDVEDEWFAEYVCYAKDQGWVEGYPDGTFQPGREVNKAESIKITLKAFDFEIFENRESKYDDADEDDWFSPYVAVAEEKNFLVEGNNDELGVAELRTRAGAFDMLARIMQIKYMDDPVYTDEIGAEFYTFLLLNKLREEYGVEDDLVLNPDLTRAARRHSIDMLNNSGLSHGGSDGSQPHERIADEISENVGSGENVGGGILGSRSLIDVVDHVHYQIFLEEPDECHNHRTTIMSKCFKFTDVGIGVAADDEYMYFTEDFVFFAE